MAGVIRGSCKSCSYLQSLSFNGAFKRSYQKPYFIRYAASTTDSFKASTQVPKKNPEFFETLVQEKQNIWQTIEHDITDVVTFDIVKQQYIERLEEISQEHKVETTPMKSDKSPDIKAKKRVKKRSKPPLATYTRNSQLTYNGEQNVLAEIDVYLYLGEVLKAYNLFNFHRRHGHKFSLDAYNKVIHAWASQGGWKNVQMLYRNLKRDGLTPNYQTFAGLLEAATCNSHEEQKARVESIIYDMTLMDLKFQDIVNKSCLSNKQIESVVNALRMVHPQVKEEYDASKELFKQPSAKASPIPYFKNMETEELVKQQFQNELDGLVKVKSIASTTKLDKIVQKRAKHYTKIIEQWKKDFLVEYIRSQHTESSARPIVYMRCMLYTKVLTPKEITDIVFDQIVPILCSQPNGIPVSFVCRRLGYLMYQKFASKYRHENGVTEKASSVLLDILKRVAVVDTAMFIKNKNGRIEQCLQHCYERAGYLNIGVLKFHTSLTKLYTAYISQLGDIAFESGKLPMVIPPRPWTSATSGAYLLQHTDLVRTVTGQYRINQLLAASEGGQINKVFDSLNYLGNTAWIVNRKLLNLMIKLFNEKGDNDIGIIGPDLPQVEEKKAKRAMTFEERQSRKQTKKLFHELFALRMELLYKLSIANHFRDQVIWTPSSLDFRGRAYPVPPHCSHIGNDVSRSLFSFAVGKKLGANGLNWLKVHLVNVHGQLKKSSLGDRIAYADQHLEEIFDSADHPLDGCGWWKGGSEPWQTLLVCMEIANAIRSGDPENYVSHIAIHMDGSCNGLQHYAAMGQDEYGARQVNLAAAARPQDVYSEVANLVEKKRKDDAKNGVLIAQQLEGKVTRKVVKQTVMTVVYGVTFVGGRLQIEKQLKDLNVPEEIIFKASVYVVQEVFKSLARMFTSARQIQDWLTVSAAQIALTGNCVDWVTPLGLPVVQPYHRETNESIPTPLQYVTSKNLFDHTQVPHLTKQKGGFPPNFVHSLDSCHMMLTALRCRDARMTFASVHDSFWTHACDIEKLNQFCREEFVALHQMPILQDLKKHFEEKYSGLPLRKPLKDGTTHAQFANLPKPGCEAIKLVSTKMRLSNCSIFLLKYQENKHIRHQASSRFDILLQLMFYGVSTSSVTLITRIIAGNKLLNYASIDAHYLAASKNSIVDKILYNFVKEKETQSVKKPKIY